MACSARPPTGNRSWCGKWRPTCRACKTWPARCKPTSRKRPWRFCKRREPWSIPPPISIPRPSNSFSAGLTKASATCSNTFKPISPRSNWTSTIARSMKKSISIAKSGSRSARSWPKWSMNTTSASTNAAIRRPKSWPSGPPKWIRKTRSSCRWSPSARRCGARRSTTTSTTARRKTSSARSRTSTPPRSPSMANRIKCPIGPPGSGSLESAGN